MLPFHARCAFSRLCCIGHSLLLNSYFFRIHRSENASCSVGSHPPRTPLILFFTIQLQGLFVLLAPFASLFLSSPLVVQIIARLLELHGFLPCPQSLARRWVTTTTTTTASVVLKDNLSPLTAFMLRFRFLA